MANSWETTLKINGWVSDYPSVNNLLMHIKHRKTGSEASRIQYCFYLYDFCRHQQKTPDQLLTLEKTAIESMLENYCYRKMEKTWHCPGTANNALATLKTFFKVNGYKGNNQIDLECFHVTSRERVKPQYIPTLAEAQKMADVAGNLRNRAIILFLTSTGLRNSTLRALQYNAIKTELENGYPNLLIKIQKEMKNIVSRACKGKIEYCTFTSQDATEALKLYLNERQRKMGQIQEEDVLFCTSYNQVPQAMRPKLPMSARELQLLIKETAFKAGIKEWKDVSPHCLRKTFDSILRSQLCDGDRIDFKTQEYFMGHILPGSADTYFGTSFNQTKIEELRKEYAKLVFRPQGQIDADIVATLRSIAETFGIDLNRLEENKKKELGRPANDAEKLGLIKQAIFQLRNNLKNVETETPSPNQEAITQSNVEKYVPPQTAVAKRQNTKLPIYALTDATFSKRLQQEQAKNLKIVANPPKTAKQTRKPIINQIQPASSLELSITTEKQRQYALFPLKQDQRQFFPGYKTPFTIETDIGKITTAVTSGKQNDQIGDPEAGKYVMGGLRPWFRNHMQATRVRFICIQPNKYQLTVLPEAIIYA